MKRVQKLKVVDYAKVNTVISAFAGFVAGLIYSFVGLAVDVATIGLNKGTALAFIAIPLMPLYFAVAGAIVGLVGAALYNYSAKWFGGINIDVER